MKLSISEAARRAGVTRVTIYKKLKAGELSKEAGEDGTPVIDLSELARLYPQAVNTDDTGGYTNEYSQDYRLLQAELEHLRERLADTERRAERAESDKSRLFDQLQATTRLLERPRAEPEHEEQLRARLEKAQEARDYQRGQAARPWWKRLF